MSVPKFPRWSEPRKAFTLALNQSQAEALLDHLSYKDDVDPELSDEDYNDLVQQLTIITKGEGNG